MPVFAAWLASFLSPLFAWIATKFTARVALIISLLAAFATTWGVLAAAAWGIIQGISINVPANFQFFFFLLPPETPALITASASADLAASAYAYARNNIMIKAHVAG